MNRSSIAKRITQAAEDSKIDKRGAVMRCWLSDGTVKDMDIIRACTFNRGELIDNEVIFPEPYIKKAECIRGEDSCPKLISVCLQMINYQVEQREQSR